MQRDLPSESLKGKDIYEKFEISLPFSRTNVKTFADTIELAHKECGGEGFVTLEALRKFFTTQAWIQLSDESSKLCKVLLSDALKNADKAHSANQIDSTWLMCYGLIAC